MKKYMKLILLLFEFIVHWIHLKIFDMNDFYPPYHFIFLTEQRPLIPC